MQLEDLLLKCTLEITTFGFVVMRFTSQHKYLRGS